MKLPVPAPLLVFVAALASCAGGIRVHRHTGPIPGAEDPLHGVPFHRRVAAIKTTEWVKKDGTVLWKIEEPTTLVDRSTTYVVSGVDNRWNPFDTLEFTAKLGDDDTLSEVAYKADPQLSSALKSAGDAKGAGLYGGLDDAMAPPEGISDQAFFVRVKVTPVP